MRHRKEKGRLNRRSSWRKATLKSLANDLFTYQRIETTLAKAKALKSYAEPLITTAKDYKDEVSAKRQVFKKLCDRSVVQTLFNDLAPLYKDVPGGYTRILNLGTRKGDGASMAIIELVKRTISDEELLGISTAKEEKPVKKKKASSKKEGAKEVKTSKTAAKGKKSKEKAETSDADTEAKPHAAPEVDIEEKEKRAVEDVKKEKAKTEQKKVAQKGIFKRFRRKSI